MFTIKENETNEIIINKSKFITYAFKIDNKEMILNYLHEIKQKYKDATHVCYAYSFSNTKKAFDDGEPSHTAGSPILNVIDSNELNNVLIVVVRYFGGIKLGAGGLVRAYSSSASEVIKKAKIIQLKETKKIKIIFNYKDIDIINHLLKNYKITYKEFSANVVYEFVYEIDNYPKEIDNYIIEKKEL